MKNWEKEFEELPAVNYNLYLGSGKEVCDNCLEFENAVNQIKSFIHQNFILREEVERVIKEMQKELTSFDDHFLRKRGYNKALTDLKQKLNEK